MSNPSGESVVLECQQLSKSFKQGSEPLDVLRNVTFQVLRGDRMAIIGASGSGKSTLLHLLGGLDTPTSGTVSVAGRDLSTLSDAARGTLRNQALGFVYQFHHLLPEFTALENVAMPLLIRGEKTARALQQATALLKRVGLSARLSHKPGELSGGERQRAAVARAVVTQPSCVLADEPTGNLDRQSAEQVFELMLSLNHELGTSLIVVTHDIVLAGRMQTIWRLTDGVLQPERALHSAATP